MQPADRLRCRDDADAGMRVEEGRPSEAMTMSDSLMKYIRPPAAMP